MISKELMIFVFAPMVLMLLSIMYTKKLWSEIGTSTQVGSSLLIYSYVVVLGSFVVVDSCYLMIVLFIMGTVRLASVLKLK